jgi:hypothetical protein
MLEIVLGLVCFLRNEPNPPEMSWAGFNPEKHEKWCSFWAGPEKIQHSASFLSPPPRSSFVQKNSTIKSKPRVVPSGSNPRRATRGAAWGEANRLPHVVPSGSNPRWETRGAAWGGRPGYGRRKVATWPCEVTAWGCGTSFDGHGDSDRSLLSD